MSAAAGSASVASSPIPFKPVTGAEQLGGGLGWLPVLLCVGLALLLILLQLRKGRTLPGLGMRKKSISVVESVRLSDRERLSVVHYRGRALLVAHGGQTATVLANDPIEAGAAEDAS